MRRLIDLLRDPTVAGLDMDGPDRLGLHRTILQRKSMLREVFTEFHRLFWRLDQQYLNGEGLQVELGAGVAPMRESYPQVLATDVVFGEHLDLVIDAERMDLEDQTVRTVYGQNCFHHFMHPDRFFAELERVLVPGGGAILLEPYYGSFASFVFKRLFPTEGFDKTAASWEEGIRGPMGGANQALSYIVFVRDRAWFEERHPSLAVVHSERVNNYLKYLLSGGLNFRQLLPDASGPIIEGVQRCLSPLNAWLSLHHVIVLRKQPS